MRTQTGKRVAVSAVALAGMLCSVSGAGLAQDAEHDWQKQYAVSGTPSLIIETGDSGLDLRSCGGCSTVRIQVHTDDQLSRYDLEERQEGNTVNFRLKEKPHTMALNWHSRHAQVTVEAPAKLELRARTSDGHAVIRGVEGVLEVHTSDGGVEMEDVRGTLRVTSSDGQVSIRRASGTLEAHASDGGMQVDGQFSAVQMRTSDGNLDFALAPGSQLTEASRIESSDGRVTIRVPQNLAATLDVSTSDGSLDCKLPLTTDHYDSRESSGHKLHGQLNHGTVPLSVHTSDGSVQISSL